MILKDIKGNIIKENDILVASTEIFDFKVVEKDSKLYLVKLNGRNNNELLDLTQHRLNINDMIIKENKN